MLSYPKSARVRVWSCRTVERISRSPRVLVVDDFEIGAHAIAAYLTIEPMDCRIALSGAEAIATGLTWQPDVFVMDISMPIMNGFEVTDSLRRDSRTHNAIIVAFTALDETKVCRNPMSRSFDGYCQKGQLPAALAALIEHFIL